MKKGQEHVWHARAWKYLIKDGGPRISKIPYCGYVSYVRINSAVFYFFVARIKAESATGRRLVGDWSATESPSDD